MTLTLRDLVETLQMLIDQHGTYSVVVVGGLDESADAAKYQDLPVLDVEVDHDGAAISLLAPSLAAKGSVGEAQLRLEELFQRLEELLPKCGDYGMLVGGSWVGGSKGPHLADERPIVGIAINDTRRKLGLVHELVE